MAAGVPLDEILGKLSPTEKSKFLKEHPELKSHSQEPVQPVTSTPSSPKPGTSKWEQFRKGAGTVGEKVKGGLSKFQEFARNHPVNNPAPKAGRSARKEPNKANWRESRGKVSSRDIFKDGVKVETVHYTPAHPPRSSSSPKRARREDPLGGFGKGVSPAALMGGHWDPMTGYSPTPTRSPRKGKGKKSRKSREPSPAGYNYIEHMNSIPDYLDNLF